MNNYKKAIEFCKRMTEEDYKATIKYAKDMAIFYLDRESNELLDEAYEYCDAAIGIRNLMESKEYDDEDVCYWAMKYYQEYKGISLYDLEREAMDMGYVIRDKEAWRDYCDSVTSDYDMTIDQVREELAAFKRIEEGEER